MLADKNQLIHFRKMDELWWQLEYLSAPPRHRLSLKLLRWIRFRYVLCKFQDHKYIPEYEQKNHRLSETLPNLVYPSFCSKFVVVLLPLRFDSLFELFFHLLSWCDRPLLVTQAYGHELFTWPTCYFIYMYLTRNWSLSYENHRHLLQLMFFQKELQYKL